MIELQVAHEGDKERWDNLVFQSKVSTFFHQWDFLKVMEKHSKKKIGIFHRNPILYPLIAVEKNIDIGIMPVFIFPFPLLKIATSPPFAVEDYFLGPLLPFYEKEKASTRDIKYDEFISAIDNFLRKNLGSSFISIHSCPGIDDSRPFTWAGYSVEPGYTSYISLDKGLDFVYNNFSRNLKGDIKKAEVGGILVRQGAEGDIIDIFNALYQRKRIHASLDYIIDVYHAFPENFVVLIAEKDGKFISGMILCGHKDRMSFWIGCPRCSFQGINPNVLLMWTAMKEAYKNGFKTFENMGNDDRSLFTFKSKFSGQLIPFFYIKRRPLGYCIVKCLSRMFREKL